MQSISPNIKNKGVRARRNLEIINQMELNQSVDSLDNAGRCVAPKESEDDFVAISSLINFKRNGQHNSKVSPRDRSKNDSKGEYSLESLESKKRLADESSDSEPEAKHENTMNDVGTLRVPIKAWEDEAEYAIPVPQEDARRERQDKLRRKRREESMEMVRGFLSGGASIIWLFLIGDHIPGREFAKAAYAEYDSLGYEAPLCSSIDQANLFLGVQGCLFKVVADVVNCEELMKGNNERIITIYIYNPLREEGINRALKMKNQSRKVRGISTNLTEFIKQAQWEMSSEERFLKDDQGRMVKQRGKCLFPGFLRLDSTDCSQATVYRLSLYGALKLKGKQERKSCLEEFQALVRMKYQHDEEALSQLNQYLSMEHLSMEHTSMEHTSSKHLSMEHPSSKHPSSKHPSQQNSNAAVLKFYVRETFYYKVTNTMLRIARAPIQFRPVTLPFNEIYHAIREYYVKDKARKAFRAYRGTRLKAEQVQLLEIGTYIELLGFVSTSLSRSQAEKFLDRDSYLLIFEVGEGEPRSGSRSVFEGTPEGVPEDMPDEFDHGYVDINEYGLAAGAFESEQEVLFNALNIYKVTRKDSGSREIYLEYGSVFPLLKKKKLTEREKSVVANYRYCVETSAEIEDDGDVYLLTEDHDKCKDYYISKIDEGDTSAIIQHKLANAFYQAGDLEQAYQRALIAISKAQHSPKHIGAQHSPKHIEKTRNIFLKCEDYLKYEESSALSISLYGKTEWMERAKALYDRAQGRFKQGRVKESLLDLEECEAFLKSVGEEFVKRRRSIEWRHRISSLCCACTGSAARDLQLRTERETLDLDQEELRFSLLANSINQLNINIEAQRTKIALYLCDSGMLRNSQIAYQLHLSNIAEPPQHNPLAQAKYKAQEAVVAPTAEISLMEAVELASMVHPLHEKVGEYSKSLGEHRMKALIYSIEGANQESGIEGKEGKEGELEQPRAAFNYEKQECKYRACKQAFELSAKSSAYNNKVGNPEYLSVKNLIGQLEVHFTKLKEGTEVAMEVANSPVGLTHTEGAKALLLLAKIAMARGEVKKAFTQIEHAEGVLRRALIKQEGADYEEVLRVSVTYLDIGLQRSKVFMRQLRHDLAIQELKVLKRLARKKGGDEQSNSFLATIYEEQAEALISTGDTRSFERRLLISIEMREKSRGRFNVPNAVAYANLCRYMLCLQDIETARKYHNLATEIFSRYAAQHPMGWVILLSNGLLYFKEGKYEEAVEQLRECLLAAQRKYSKDHVNVLKIKLQYGKMLGRAGRYEEATTVLEALLEEINENVKESQEVILKIVDDERLAIRKTIFQDLRDTYIKAKDSFHPARVQKAIAKCADGLNEHYQQHSIHHLQNQPKGNTK